MRWSQLRRAAALVWVVLFTATTLGTWWWRARKPQCLPSPHRIPGDNLTAPLHEDHDDRHLRFMLLWSTSAASFSLRSRRCIESIFFHHPHAHVRVYSNQLPRGFFSEFRSLGFDARVVRYNVKRLLMGTPAAPWVANMDEWEKGAYYYSHVTDAIRLALLYRHGGVYLDTDVLLVRPMTLAAAAGSRMGAGPPPLHDALGLETYADPRTGLPTLNGAVMAFQRGSRFLWNCLHEFAADYKADRWSWNGPELLTRVQARCADAVGAAVQVEPPKTFYPLHWDAVTSYADGLHPATDAAMWETITSSSYTVHVWNRKTADLTFVQGSLFHKLHNTWLVLPDKALCS